MGHVWNALTWQDYPSLHFNLSGVLHYCMHNKIGQALGQILVPLCNALID